MLVESTVRGCGSAHAIDCFGDQETRDRSAFLQVVDWDRFADDVLLRSAIEAIALVHPGLQLVYGSGVDHRPALLESLVQLPLRLCGNTPAVLKRVTSPAIFFPMLEGLGIPVPETRLDPPASLCGWLFKQNRSQGGTGVHRAISVPDTGSREGIYQRLVRGSCGSVLFLADGNDCEIIGFNSQWTCSLEGHEFLFGGISSYTEYDSAAKKQVVGYVHKLVESALLKGLNSLDFIVRDGKCLVLEVNPRPGASMALYDRCFELGLVWAHIEAVNGRLVRPSSAGTLYHAFEVIYAPQAFYIGTSVNWPSWSTDRPPAGTRIEAGMPVCSITASGADGSGLRSLLHQRKITLLKLIRRGHPGEADTG